MGGGGNPPPVIGSYYIAKVSGKQTIVQIKDNRLLSGGWTTINCATGRRIYIRSAQRLRREVLQSEYEKSLR